MNTCAKLGQHRPLSVIFTAITTTITWLIALGFSSALSADEIFLALDSIDGDSTVPGFEDEIIVSNWSWQLSNTEGSRGTPTVRPIKIIKEVDKATPKLMDTLLNRSVIVQGTMTVRGSNNSGQPATYLTIVMDNIRVTSVSTEGEATAGIKPSESVTLTFEEVCLNHTSFSNTGQPLPPVQSCYDLTSGP